MDSLNQIFTEQEVNDVANKILNSSIEKVKDELSNKFYSEMSSFLDEHYLNKKNEIEKKLIDQIADNYISEPTLYKFSALRQKMFLENKDLIVKTLSEEAIKNSVEDVIMQYTHRDYNFSWKWKDEIVRVILSNWNLFKEDERINDRLLHEIERLKNQISNLQYQLNEVNEKLY